MPVGAAATACVNCQYVSVSRALGDGLFIVVSGPPGSGKSTVASGLARAFGLAVFSKDTIKEALMDQLGCADVEQSRRLGAAAIEVLLAMAMHNGGGVLDSTWRPSLSRPRIARLSGRVVEVFCDCPASLARDRYLVRAGFRHPGHFDTVRGGDVALWTGEAAEPIDGGWPMIRLDTSTPTEIDAVARQLQVLLG
jgi:predicted kinase